MSLKLPDFWETQATLWFARAEAQFQLRNITADETRFNYVVSALSTATAVHVFSCLENPTMTDRYETLKSLLLAAFGLSEEERAQRLLGLRRDPPVRTAEPHDGSTRRVQLGYLIPGNISPAYTRTDTVALDFLGRHESSGHG